MAGYMRLGDLLVAAKAITEEQLEEGLRLQKENGERLGDVLINSGIITENDLIIALKEQLGIEFVDLSKIRIPIEMAQYVPKNIARQHNVVPYKIERDNLYLVMSDPMNFYAIEDVRKAVGSSKKIVPAIGTKDAIMKAIQVLYGNEGAAKAIEEMKRESHSDFSDTTNQAFISNQIGEDNVSSGPTIRLVNSILERAINERASDIHFEPKEDQMYIRMRIDGVMQSILTVPNDLMNAVISRVKIMSGLDIAERRVPQDGRFNVRIKEKDLDVRVSTLPTVYGEKIVCRLLDKTSGLISKEAIGMLPDDIKKYDRMIHCHNGVVLIVGPTGSGKSSTMNTIVGELATDMVNVVTLEDPVEYNIPRANQVQINEKTGMTFASGLRSILRQDPDIIAVGEIRDGETADIAMRAAITGHVVLSTIHTNDAISTIDRLADIGVEPYLISSALKGIISQRLVRKICPNCKEAYTPTDEELEDLGVERTEGLVFYRGKGCAHCYNSGYKGRTGVFEMLPITRALQKCIGKSEGREAMEAAARKDPDGFVTIRENAAALVKDGVTTVEEVLRVIIEED